MGEFSAHRITLSAGERVVIATPVNLYVSPYGDDVLNSGIEEGSPFRTPARAIEWLNDKYISEFGFVTINFAAGIYDLDDELTFSHEQGNRVAFVGAAPETLILQECSFYRTYRNESASFKPYMSGVTHGITLTCARPDDSTVYAPITTTNSIKSSCRVNGVGIIVEDYDLVFRDDYNPAYYYASYPFHPRNNIVRQGSLLGSHSLRGVTGGQITLESSIRDSWFCLPHNTNGGWGRYFGNNLTNPGYYVVGTLKYPFAYNDVSESINTATFVSDVNVSGSGGPYRGHYLSSVPVGYFGTNATTGITTGATANLVGASFPNSSEAGKTATYLYQGITQSGITGWYSATGPNGSFLNDVVSFGKNYHEHSLVDPKGWDYTTSLSSINTNTITVKIIPTVFRRFGNILKISSGGLRKIKNIFFDGVAMNSHYKLIGNSETGVSNKAAIYGYSTRLGETVVNEPSGLGTGLCSNCGVKDFHVGFYADRGTDVFLGKLVASNCSYGIIANNKSNIQTVGSVCTGMAAVGFGAFSSSSVVADRCFCSFSGQSHVTIRIKQTPSGVTLDDSSYIPGQTFGTPDSKIRGTVWDWDPRDKTLVIAVRGGFFEGLDPAIQN